MTVKELREILFEVKNQDLTVKELREILFEVKNQDDELTTRQMYELTK